MSVKVGDKDWKAMLCCISTPKTLSPVSKGDGGCGDRLFQKIFYPTALEV